MSVAYEFYGDHAGASVEDAVAAKIATLMRTTDARERRRLLDEIPEMIAASGTSEILLNALEKAHRLEINEQVRKVTGVNADIFAPEVIQQLDRAGVRQKPSRLNAHTLRLVAARDPIFSAILNTRASQVGAFCRRVRGAKGEKGFVIIPADPERKVKPSERRMISELTNFLLKTGFTVPPKRRTGKWWEYRDEDLRMFSSMLVRDTLTLDLTAIYIQRTRGGMPWAMWLLDPALVYRVGANAENDEKYRYCQVDALSGTPKYFYTDEELIFDVMNPTSDIRFRGYGMSILESLLEIITGLLFGISYNRKQFMDSTLPKGVLAIIGEVSDETMAAFKREWIANISGGQPWRSPIINVEKDGGLDYKPLMPTNRDMEFLNWLQFLITVECSVAQIDPEEIGFRLNVAGQSTLFGESPGTAQTRLAASRDRGLGGILDYVSEQFTKVIQRFKGMEDFVVEFVGLNEEDDLRKLEAYRQALDLGLTTVAELREREGLELPEKWRDMAWIHAPVNPMLFGAYMQEVSGGEGGGPAFGGGAGGMPIQGGEGEEPPEYPAGRDYDDLIAELMGKKGGEKAGGESEEAEEAPPLEKSLRTVKEIVVTVRR